jgi:hypothetical protein
VQHDEHGYALVSRQPRRNVERILILRARKPRPSSRLLGLKPPFEPGPVAQGSNRCGWQSRFLFRKASTPQQTVHVSKPIRSPRCIGPTIYLTQCSCARGWRPSCGTAHRNPVSIVYRGSVPSPQISKSFALQPLTPPVRCPDFGAVGGCGRRGHFRSAFGLIFSRLP